MNRILNLTKKVGYLMLFFHPIDTYRLNLPIPISLFRFFLILFVFLSFICVCTKIRTLTFSKLTKQLFVLFCIGNIIGAFQIYNLSEWAPLMLNNLMGIFIIYCMIIIYDYNDINTLLKSFLFSFIFVLISSTYVYYMFFSKGELVDYLPFGDVLPVISDDNLAGATEGFFPRLALPYITSPHLAVTLSLQLIMACCLPWNNKYVKNIVICLLLLSIMGSMTRTVWLSLSLTTLCYLCFFTSWTLKYKIKLLVKLLIAVGIVGCFLFFIIPSDITELFGNKLFGRFSSNITDTSDESGRHYLLFFEAFYISFDNLKNFIIGIGDGNLWMYKGVNTYLPPTMLNSFLTSLVFRGVLGLCCFICIYVVPVIVFYKRLKVNKCPYNIIFWSGNFNLLIAFCTYEIVGIFSIWIWMGMSYLYLQVGALSCNKM